MKAGIGTCGWSGTVGTLEDWLLPTFRGRLLFCTRVAISVALSSAWVFAPQTSALFPPSILIPLAAVCGLWAGLVLN
jgi:hypothetical protein